MNVANTFLFGPNYLYEDDPHNRWLQQPGNVPTSAPTTLADAAIVVPWSTVWVTLLVSMTIGFLLFVVTTCFRERHYRDNNYDLFEMRQYGYAQDAAPGRLAKPWGYREEYGKWWGWAREAIVMSDTDTLRIVGMDAFMFLRFLRLSFRCSLFGTVLGCLILIPVYATGEAEGNDTEEFNSITLAKVEQGSNRLWATAVCWWLFVAFVVREIHFEWQHVYAPRRYEFLARGAGDTDQEYRYAVLIEYVPSHLRTNKALYGYLNNLFPNSIHQVHVCMHTGVLDVLVKKRTNILNKLEQAIAFTTDYPDKPTPTTKEGSNICGCGGVKTEAIPMYQAEISKLNEEIDEERSQLFVQAMAAAGGSSDGGTGLVGMFQNIQNVNLQDLTQNLPGMGVFQRKSSASDSDKGDNKKRDGSDVDDSDGKAKVQESLDGSTGVPIQESNHSASSNTMTSTAFVTFTSLKAKQAAIQCNIAGRVDYLESMPAPEPKAIVWDNVTVPADMQRNTSTILGAIWTLGIVFWAIPATFVTGLANLNSLLEAVGIEPLNPDTFWYGLLAGILPVLALQLFMVLLCMAIMLSAAFVIRKKSQPEIDGYTFSWYMMYQFANLWLILIGGSAFNQLDAMIKDPESIATLMASAVPGASTFFLNMTILNTWVMSMFYLSNLTEFFQQIGKSFIEPRFKTDRFMERKKPRELLWGFYLPPIVFIVLVSFVYMAIVPLLEPFTATLFGLYYLVWKHNCLHIYGNIGEGGGVIWEKIFRYMMVCLYTAEVIVCAYLGIKEGPGPAISCVVPFVVTILWHLRLGRNVIGPLKHLSMAVAAQVDKTEGELSTITPADSNEAFAQAIERKLYGQPNLKPSKDEREPRPYHGAEGGAETKKSTDDSAIVEHDEETGRADSATKEEAAVDINEAEPATLVDTAQTETETEKTKDSASEPNDDKAVGENAKMVTTTDNTENESEDAKDSTEK